MTAVIHSVDLMEVTPDDVTVRTHDHFAVARICGVTIYPQFGRRKTVEEYLGQLEQIGERLAREARRAGHAHRTELRTRLLAEAVAS